MSPEEMRALVPAAVLRVCEVLEAAGCQAWIVGGAVRDLVLDTVPSDWDVASDCLPERVLELFEKTIATGLEHGTVTAVLGRGRARESVEITTFRGEGAYSDSRRPDEVHFGVPLDEDLKRRDFVINAMAFDPLAGTIHDPFGGVADAQARLIRAVGTASERFNEDGLRVMRAVRFVSTLGFDLESETEAGIGTALEALAKVAQERVRVELLKLLGGKAPERALQIAARTGILAVILPELAPENYAAAFERAALAGPDPVVALGALLMGIDAEVLEALLRRLTMSNEDRQRIHGMLREVAAFDATLSDAELRAHLSRVGRRHAQEHLAVLSAEAKRNGSEAALQTLERARAILEADLALEVGELALRGKELMAITGARGPEVGALLRALLEAVLEKPERNTRETLERLALDLAPDPTSDRSE